MLTFDTAGLRARVKAADPADPALAAVDAIDFLEFAGLEESVRADVRFLQEHPLVLPETKVTGWVYEVETGKVRASSAAVVRCGAAVACETGALTSVCR